MGKGKSENVQVILRVRPLSRKELEEGHKDVVRPDFSANCVYVDEAGVDGRAWAFDAVYNNTFSQRDVYIQSIQPLVETVLNGFNSTIFAYGQSGTGKTYSMCGVLSDREQYGIIPNALAHIFRSINDLRSDKMEYHVQASFVELYNGKCRDLMVDGRSNLDLKENANKLFYVKDLSMWDVTSVAQAMQLMEEGLTRREVKATNLNADSSRSHSLFTLYVRTYDKAQDLRTEAKLNLVDLAGSERLSKTGAAGEAAQEGTNINLSLTALGTVIDCLVKSKPHIPYRSSPLTMLLKDGLGGNSRTLIVGTIGPSSSNASETVSTLRFIDRAKQIKNKPKVQMDPKDARIADLLEEIEKLKRQLGITDPAEEVDEEAADSPEAVERRRRATVFYDDEIDKFRRRVEELEVEIASGEDAVRQARTIESDFAKKEERLRRDFDDHLQRMEGKLADLQDRRAFADGDGDGEDATILVSLRALCTTYLSQADPTDNWYRSVKEAAVERDEEPHRGGAKALYLATIDDIARGFQIVEACGPRVRHSPHPTPRPFVSDAPAEVAPSATERHVSSAPAEGPIPPVDEAPTRSPRSHAVSAPTSARPPCDDAPSGDEAVDDPRRERRERKDKRDKRDKRRKKDRLRTQHVPRAPLDAVQAQPLPPALLADAAAKLTALAAQGGGVDEVLADLLTLQRADVLRQVQARMDSAEGDVSSVRSTAEALLHKGTVADVVGLLCGYTQLQHELTAATERQAKQRAQLDKSNAIAQKKIDEVITLRDQLEAVRHDVVDRERQHERAVAEMQERLVAQFNKKMDAQARQHQKAIGKERRAHEGTGDKVEELCDRIAELERRYDVKVMEYEQILADFEQAKLDGLRRYKEMQLQHGWSVGMQGSVAALEAHASAKRVMERVHANSPTSGPIPSKAATCGISDGDDSKSCSFPRIHAGGAAKPTTPLPQLSPRGRPQ